MISFTKLTNSWFLTLNSVENYEAVSYHTVSVALNLRAHFLKLTQNTSLIHRCFFSECRLDSQFFTLASLHSMANRSSSFAMPSNAENRLIRSAYL